MLDLNHDFVKGLTPPTRETYLLRVPVGSKVLVERKIANTKWNTPVYASTASPSKPASKSTRSPSSLAPAPTSAGPGYVYHMVQRGDSLWSISEKYNVTIQSIFKWNSLKKSRIFPGNKLKIQVTSKANS
jgi:LysM repeat protein